MTLKESGEQSFHNPGNVIKTVSGVYEVPAEYKIPSIFPMPQQFKEKISLEHQGGYVSFYAHLNPSDYYFFHKPNLVLVVIFT
jgi:hypothetical protein